MKIIIAGGSGQVGMILQREFKKHEVRILTRDKEAKLPFVYWDAKNLDAWVNEIDGSDVVINLAGRTVNCRYTEKNLKDMYDSRIDSARAIGEAIKNSSKPPKVWMQMSTATIYAHSFDRANDEYAGVMGGSEPNVPRYWDFSIKIAKDWEAELMQAKTPQTRKIALRSAMVMSADKGGIFDTLLGISRLGLGGSIAGGEQFMSWIHADDFVGIIKFLIEREDVEGVINLAAPNPIAQKDFMKILRHEIGMPIGLPATAWMSEIGAFFMRTDTELILKSRKVISKRLEELGYEYKYHQWSDACRDLVGPKESIHVSAEA